MKIYTESSLYEFDLDKQMCRRTMIVESTTQPLRQDNNWVRYFGVSYEVGQPIVLVLEHLSGESGQFTIRRTSPVVKIEA